MKIQHAFLAVFALIASSAMLSAQVISVNFVGGQGTTPQPPPGGAAVTSIGGVVQVGNWNNASGASGSILNAINDAGATTGATINWTSPNTWAATNTAPGGGGSAALMSGYLDNFSNAGQSITVTGLPTSFTQNGYDVYVYHASDSAGVQGYTATDNLANTTGQVFGRQAGGAGTNFPLASPDGFIVSTDTTNGPGTTASNVILLQGLTGSSFTLTGIAGASGDGRARPNGFQIVAIQVVPEPASLAVWFVAGSAIAGLAIFRLRRRQK